MKVLRPIFFAIALLVSVFLAVPVGVAAQAAPPAGKITFLAPIVNVVHGPQQIPASLSQQVFWGDVVNTGHLARARIALMDGSILSVGSDSNLTIAKHDAAEQQTDLDLNYGAVRARAVKLVKPNAHFRVRTPVGVAGVVGTEMIVIFGSDGQMHVLCLEGSCQVCDLLLNCIPLKAGEETGIRNNQPPGQPTQATPMNVTTAVNATNPASAGAGAAGAGAGGAGGGLGAAGGVVTGVGAAVGATVATVVVRSVATTKTCSTPPPTTPGAAPRANCTKVTSTGMRIPGQKP